MKTYTIKLLIISMLCLGQISCNDDYLDLQPLNNPSDGTFLSTRTEVEMALAGCYSGLWANYQGMPFQLSFDMVTDIGYERNGSGMQAVGRGDHDAMTDYIIQIWQNMYAAIAKCNYLLKNIDRAANTMDQEAMESVMAEARFLRAMYYHYLVELYGDLPLVTTPLALSETNVPRTPKKEVVGFILDELEQSIPHLKTENNPLSGRATKAAAWALMSRVALFNERWEESISASQKAMELEGSQLIIDPDYMSLFQYKGEGSKEIIFSVQYLEGANVHPMFRLLGSRNAGGHTNKKPSYQLSDAWECVDGLQIDESPLFDAQNPYANRDPRLGFTLAVSGSTYLGFQYETHGDSIVCWDYNANPPVRVANMEATHAYATFTGVGWRKYADNLDRTKINNSELNTIVFRYAEILLNYAEAKIEMGQIDNTVLEAINKIRQRPSVNMPLINTLDPDELRYAVRRERKYELAGEGLRLFDLRRWKLAEEVMKLPVLGRMKKSYPSIPPKVDKWGSVYYDNIPVAAPGEPSDFKMRMVEARRFNEKRDYLWPIPYIELETNEALIQNVGY